MTFPSRSGSAARRIPGVLGAVLVAMGLLAGAAAAAPLGKVRGKVIAADSGEPIGFADVSLVPADSTQHPVGGYTNADGTYLFEVAPGRYTLRVRAISYTAQAVADIAVTAGDLVPVNVALQLEAILQKEVVVEAQAKTNTDVALIQTRRKAASVGDAVSAEQVRRTPDKNAAEVLRRVTGLSVTDGKYVFVRGLGERYSSTEVDGVRIASPEQNKRVVPLDLVPAGLLDHITVQKTYTADRPGEFGGGDVQVRTRDFPGARTWSLSMSQGYEDGVTFRDRKTYRSSSRDLFGFGADSRGIPDAVYQITGDQPVFEYSYLDGSGFQPSVLKKLARSFSNVWSATSERAIPNASYSASYGDEFDLLGHRLGLLQTWSYARNFDYQRSAARYFDGLRDTLYDYVSDRWNENVQLGGVSAVSVRLSPGNTVHVRGLYTNNADDEVRIYEGPDHNRPYGVNQYISHRATRLMYVERSIASGSVEGAHELPGLFHSKIDWAVSRSEARRQQPDRRETIYDKRPTNGSNWTIGSPGVREYGDLKDSGHGVTVSQAIPLSFRSWGSGKFVAGFDSQVKGRTNHYRRFNTYYGNTVGKTQTPEAIFADTTAYVVEATLPGDNYRARQRVEAAYVTMDLPFGRAVRGNFGVRRERGYQDIVNLPLYVKESDLAQAGHIDGRFETLDWLPSANLTWSVVDRANLRFAASQTISRPDLNELSSSRSLEYVAGYQVGGNPNLHRALIDNYDVRAEVFPGLSELFAAGFFYKRLRDPIEQVIQAGSPNILVPRNSFGGRNYGWEFEARSSLGRVWRPLRGLSLNSNATFISSNVKLLEHPGTNQTTANEHPLQGQASYLVNASLGYTSPKRDVDLAVLAAFTGKRLTELAEGPLGNVYEQPCGALDVTALFAPVKAMSLKLGARNLLDPTVRQLQGGKELSSYRKGRSYSIAWSYNR